MREPSKRHFMYDRDPAKQPGPEPEPETNLLYESITRMQWGLWNVRVWRAWIEDDKFQGANQDLHTALYSLRQHETGPVDILRVLLPLERVNAVEVVDASGNGTVVYKDWP